MAFPMCSAWLKLQSHSPTEFFIQCCSGRSSLSWYYSPCRSLSQLLGDLFRNRLAEALGIEKQQPSSTQEDRRDEEIRPHQDDET
eukprot:Skav228995  [mRNA]  locus=scaffold127:181868:182758:+ [translate_table: standard]